MTRLYSKNSEKEIGMLGKIESSSMDSFDTLHQIAYLKEQNSNVVEIEFAEINRAQLLENGDKKFAKQLNFTCTPFLAVRISRKFQELPSFF
jgi:hypothetical protein